MFDINKKFIKKQYENFIENNSDENFRTLTAGNIKECLNLFDEDEEYVLNDAIEILDEYFIENIIL